MAFLNNGKVTQAIALEYDKNTKAFIQEYECEVLIKNNELSLSFVLDDGNFGGYKGKLVSENCYKLKSTTSDKDTATLTLITEDDYSTLDGFLFEENEEKEWIIEETL